MEFLLQWLENAWTQLVTFLQGLPLHLFTGLMSGLAAVVNWIPAPPFFSNIAGWIGSIPSLAAFLLSALQIGTLVTILVAAYPSLSHPPHFLLELTVIGFVVFCVVSYACWRCIKWLFWWAAGR